MSMLGKTMSPEHRRKIAETLRARYVLLNPENRNIKDVQESKAVKALAHLYNLPRPRLDPVEDTVENNG